MEYQVRLVIDGNPIRMNRFVQKFVKNITMGVIASLSDIPEAPTKISLSIRDGSDILLDVNEAAAAMNEFVQEISKKVLLAMIASLEQIPENPRNIVFSLTAES